MIHTPIVIYYLSFVNILLSLVWVTLYLFISILASIFFFSAKFLLFLG